MTTASRLTGVDALARRYRQLAERRIKLADERVEAGADKATARDLEIVYRHNIELIAEYIEQAEPRVEAWIDAGADTAELDVFLAGCLLTMLPDDDFAAGIREYLADLARGPIGPEGFRRHCDPQAWSVAILVLKYVDSTSPPR